MTEEELWYKFDLMFHSIYYGRIKSYRKMKSEKNTLEIYLINDDVLHFVYHDSTSWALYFDTMT